jgi:predicted PurR-regulated permease PerM
MLVGMFLVVSSVMTTTKNMTDTMDKMIKENAKYNAQILQILNEMKNKSNTTVKNIDNSQYQVTNEKPKEVIVHGNLPDKPLKPVTPVNEIVPPS